MGVAQRLLFARQFHLGACRRRLQLQNCGGGIGSRFMALVAGVLGGLVSRRAAVVQPGGWEYTNASLCPERAHECYFRPITACRQELPTAQIWNRKKDDVTEENERSFSYKNLEVGENMRWNFRDLVAAAVPPSLSHRSPFWMACQAALFLLQPREEVWAAVEAARGRLLPAAGLPYIAMHIRHGDKGLEAELQPLDAYMRAAEQIRRDFGVDHVVLSTDNDEAARRAARDYPAFRVTFTDHPAQNRSIYDALVREELDGHGEAMNALINILLAADADYFVGTFSSNWGRLVVMLAYALYGRPFSYYYCCCCRFYCQQNYTAADDVSTTDSNSCCRFRVVTVVLVNVVVPTADSDSCWPAVRPARRRPDGGDSSSSPCTMGQQQ